MSPDAEAMRSLSRAVREVVAAVDARDALERLIEVYAARYDLERASIVRIPRTGPAQVEATWTAARSRGASRVGYRLSPGARRFADELRTGGAHVIDTGALGLQGTPRARPPGGIRSWVALPIRSDGDLAGVLNLTSARPDAFSDAEVVCLSGLAAGIGPHLARLLEPARGSRGPRHGRRR